MTRLTLNELLLKNLKQELPEGSTAYMTQKSAYNALKKWTGQDFGYDAQKWEDWISQNGFPVVFSSEESKIEKGKK